MADQEQLLFQVTSAHPTWQQLKTVARLPYIDQSKYLRKIFVDFIDWEQARSGIPRYLAAFNIQALSLPPYIPMEHLDMETPLITKTVMITIQPSATLNRWLPATSSSATITNAEKRIIVRAILRKASLVADEAFLSDDLLDSWRDCPTHFPRICVHLCYFSRFSSTGVSAIEAHSLPLVYYAGTQSRTEVRRSATETCITEVPFFGQATIQALDHPSALAPGRLLAAIAGIGLPSKNIAAADNLLLMDVRQYLLRQPQLSPQEYSLIVVDHLPQHEHRIEIRYAGDTLVTMKQTEDKITRLFRLSDQIKVVSWGFGPENRFPQPCLVARTHEALNLATFHSMGVLAPRTALQLQSVQPNISVRLLHHLVLQSEQPPLHGSVIFTVARGGWRLDQVDTSPQMVRASDTWYLWFQASITTFPLTLMAERLTPVISSPPSIEHMPGREAYCTRWLKTAKKSSPHLVPLLERMVAYGPMFYEHHKTDQPCVPYEFKDPTDGFRSQKKSTTNISDNFSTAAKQIRWGSSTTNISPATYKKAVEEYYSDDDTMEASHSVETEAPAPLADTYRAPLWSLPPEADDASLASTISSRLSISETSLQHQRSTNGHRQKRSHHEDGQVSSSARSHVAEVQPEAASDLHRRLADLDTLRVAQLRERDILHANLLEQFSHLQAEYEQQLGELATTQLRLQQAEMLLASAPTPLQDTYRCFLDELSSQADASGRDLSHSPPHG